MRFHKGSAVRRLLAAAFILLAGSAEAGTDQWTSNGPYGGLVRVLAVDPKISGTLYAADTGGVFKSANGGASWVRSGAGITDLAIKALAIDPQTTTTLYAGTDEGGGVFKSVDGGASWTALKSTPGVINRLTIDPQTPNTIYAAVEQGGLLKSTDGGASFAAISNGLPSFGTYVALVVYPQTPTTLYAAEQTNGIFKSTNGGTSWTAANTGLSGSLINPQALVIDPQAPSTLYAAVAAAGGSGVFKTIDGGGSWALVNSQYANLIGDGFILAIDPQTPTTLYAGGYSLGALVSTNGGTSFAPINNGLAGLTNLDVLALAVDPQSPATLYAGSLNGLFATTNAGALWTAANTGLALTRIMAVTVDPVVPTTIYAGTEGAGLFKSIDGGDSWAAASTGLTLNAAIVTVIAVDPVNSTNLYATGDDGGLFKSTNGGVSWSESDSGLPQFVPITDIIVNPQTPATLLIGTSDDGVFMSNDGGSSWSAADNGLPAGESVLKLALLDPSGLSLALVGAAGGVYTSTDGGSSWVASTLTDAAPGSLARKAGPRRSGAHLPSAIPYWPEPPPGDPCFGLYQKAEAAYTTHVAPNKQPYFRLYLVCQSPDDYEDDEKGIADSFGAALAPISGPIQGAPARGAPAAAETMQWLPWLPPDGAFGEDCVPAQTVVASPVDPTIFYMGGDCGVVQGTQSGQQMVAMSLGLPPNLPVTALAITPTAGDLYAGTNGGVYRYSLVDSPLAAAVVPTSRSAQLGSTVTAFATLINTSAATATGCSLAPVTSLPASFFYQTTAPGTNAPTGSANTPVDIPAGGAQTFVFGLTPAAAFAPIDAQLAFSCSGVAPVSVLPGINTLLVSSSADPVPDIVAILATASNDGILHIPGASGSNAFAVATANLGSGDTITVSAALGSPTLPLILVVCQTDPTTGQCLAPAAASVSATVAAGATPTFAFFAAADATVPLDPVNNRIFVQFVDSTGVVRGSSSVAVETQ